ncbi:MAG: FtsQ-type POTRA domain-containing protein [Candidatus Syntrophosphaera sp.]|nr:FtsQ-type POTRA domain-containing protein [Candidatus Syntrophosphaera sp.]
MTIHDNKVETKQRSRKRRGSSRYYLYFLLILVALAGLGFGTYHLLSNVPWFNLKTVQISGNAAVPDSLIRSAAIPCLGQNLLAIPKGEIAGQVGAIARVKSVKVTPRLFSTLRVRIQERKGCLYLKSLEGDLFPVDEEGIVLEQYGAVYNENLPILTVLLNNSALMPGEKPANTSLGRVLAVHRQIAREAADFLPNISEYYTIDNTVYIIDARDGIRLIPSTKNLARQFGRYEFVRENGNVAANSILDLRFENQVVVKAGS